MPEIVKQLIERINGSITTTGDLKSSVVIVYDNDLIQLEN